MTTAEFSVTRAVFASSKTYEETVAAFEAHAGRVDAAIQQYLIQSHATAEQAAEAIAPMLGPSGLMIVAEVNPGALLSLFGKPKKARTYLLANPVIANGLFEVTAAVALHVPLRVAVYEDEQGGATLAYDKPSSLLSRFPGAKIAEAARMMDKKPEELALAATAA